MVRVFTLVVLVVAVCDLRAQSSPEKVISSGRQKRLLFYDEEGNLVKTYKNPYLYDFAQNADKIPLLGNFFNPFLSFLRPSTFGGATAYMIPVSDEVIQHINSDPVYQNKLLTLPRKELVVEPNPLCAGKRSQIPSKSCNNFLNCWDGWAFEQECPEGLMFSKEGYCDYPQNVDCSARASEPTTVKEQCSKEFESFRNEQQCNEFFVCVNRMPVRFKCPSDLYYNQEFGICDYSYRVNCKVSATMEEPAQSSPEVDRSPCVAGSTEAKKESSPSPATTTALPPMFEISTQAPVDVKTVLTSSSVVNTQSWSSSHVAISRQDAIRQLQMGGESNMNTA